MAWLQIDDNVPLHWKMLKAGPAACWLWVCGIAYSQRQLTDGFIPDLALPMVGVTGAVQVKKLADTLVSVGLFEVADGGYRVHDYQDYNATAQDARQHKAALSERRAESGRRGGIRSGIERRRVGQATKQNDREATKQNGSKPSEANKAPSQPIPIEPPTPLQGAVVLAQANAAIRDADRVVQTADRVLTDPDVGDRAREFLEQYPVIYATAKHGAAYRVKEARDFETAIELVSQWPDQKHLTDMLRLFLLKKDWASKNEPGSPRQFAFMAPQCDALLRESRRRA